MAYAAQLERTVSLSRQRVYQRLADFGDVARLVPDEVESVTLRGDGIGAVRSVRIHGLAGALEERLQALIDGRLISYSIVNDAPLPLDRYHAVVQLEDAPGDGCYIRWSSNWIARGAPAAEVRQMLTDLYGRLIDGVVRLG